MEIIRHLTSVTIYGIFLLLVGMALRYWINRRRFNRRNGAGLQGFHNYEERVTFPMIERFIKLIGLLLVLFGLFLITIEWFNHHAASRNIGKHPINRIPD